MEGKIKEERRDILNQILVCLIENIKKSRTCLQELHFKSKIESINNRTQERSARKLGKKNTKVQILQDTI